MPLSLVVLAAGKGRRFGGDKPMAAVGPTGQSLFEYSIYDAFNAGFKHVVFVVNNTQDVTEYSDRLSIYGAQLKIEFIVQDLATGLGRDKAHQAEVGRAKPWGTAHAVLVCRSNINNPFVVITADDYYGRLNFELVGNFLQDKSHDPLVGAMPGYLLKNTMSRSGSVNRGLCSVDPDGYLAAIREVRDISLDNASLPCVEQVENQDVLNNDSIVSMTFWGFHPSIFATLECAFQSFLHESTDLINDEFYIPQAVDLAIKSGKARVKVFQSTEKWKGVTYADDMVEVREYLAELSDAGLYPEFVHGLNTEREL